MIKSMTGFSKSEAREKGISVAVEIKSLNGKYHEISCRIPKSISHREFEIREIIKDSIPRASVFVNISIEYDGSAVPFKFNEEAARACYNSLRALQSKMKIRGEINFENLLHFSDVFYQKDREDNSELEWKLVKNAIKEALKSHDKMRIGEGTQILKDLQFRLKNVSSTLQKIEALGIKKIPLERERLRQKVAMLFDSDEIDEHRIQMELVLLADKLDISEECVRLNSHIKFMFESLKSKEPVGKKINFLLQEMNREINTIGSKANDTEISHLVVSAKEELERLREQIQNIE